MQVFLPESAEEAVGLLGQGVVMAGGTHVDAPPRAHRVDHQPAPRRLSRASRKARGSGSARRRRWPRSAAGSRFLRSAIESIASPTIRNLATVGGNLFVPQPHGDLAVCLLALDASVEHEGDLLTGVSFKAPERWFYTKAMRRKQNSASIVTVASDGVRIALGGVAPEPVRAYAAEEALAAGDIEAAAQLSVEAADPFDDAFASAWYRRRVLPVHVRRTLANAV